MTKRQSAIEYANHICIREAARLDDFQEVPGIGRVPTGDATDTLEAVHDVAVDAKRVARLGNRCVVRLQRQDTIQNSLKTLQVIDKLRRYRTRPDGTFPRTTFSNAEKKSVDRPVCLDKNLPKVANFMLYDSIKVVILTGRILC